MREEVENFEIISINFFRYYIVEFELVFLWLHWKRLYLCTFFNNESKELQFKQSNGLRSILETLLPEKQK